METIPFKWTKLPKSNCIASGHLIDFDTQIC